MTRFVEFFVQGGEKRGGPSSIHSTRSEGSWVHLIFTMDTLDASARASSEASEASAIHLWKSFTYRKQFRVEEDLFGFNKLTISMNMFQPKGLKQQELAPNMFVWSPNSWKHTVNLRSQNAGRKNFGAKVLRIKSFRKLLFNCSCSRNITVYCPWRKNVSRYVISNYNIGVYRVWNLGCSGKSTQSVPLVEVP